MKIVILGGDGYLGWPTAMHLAAQGHTVTIVDNYLKRSLMITSGCAPLIDTSRMAERCKEFALVGWRQIGWRVADCTNYALMRSLLEEFRPDAIVHYAEIPSAPFSMQGYDEAHQTMTNNLGTTLALIHAVMAACPDAHIIKLGTMGEYGTPNVAIKEGWLDYAEGGREQRFLYPASPGSLYHVTKVQDTHLLWLYAKTHGLRVTDIMQGPVYGMTTSETKLSPKLATSFHYDDLFGTVINRFVAEVVAGVPPTVYGKGGQTRGFIHLRDVVRCIELIASTPPQRGELRIINQIASTHTVLQLAELVCAAAVEHGLGRIEPLHLQNPRLEEEEHYFDVEAVTLKAMGLKPVALDITTVGELIGDVLPHRASIDVSTIKPRLSWRNAGERK